VKPFIQSLPAACAMAMGSMAVASDDIPGSVQAWSDGFAQAYSHYPSIEPAWEADSDVFPPCPRPGEPIPSAPRSSMTEDHRAAFANDGAAAHAACAALRPGGWRLQVRLTPADQRIFSPLVARVSQVSGSRPAEEVLTELVERGLWAAKGYQALVPIGPYIVELNVPCGASGLFVYDLADAVTSLRAIAPGSPALPERVAVSTCGRQAFALRPAAEVIADGKKPREYWGFDFPERRERAKAQGNSQ